MSDGLKNKTLHALFWSFLERFGQQGIQFVISIILARILMPEEYGLLAMLMIFMAVAKSFVDSGFGSALIQKKDATHLDECSIFYFNIFLSIGMAAILCLAAPWIATFYEQPILVSLTQVLSLNLVIVAFGLVQTTLLTKYIDFKTQMKVSVIATVLSGAIGISMAFRGFGVWSLVAQSLSSNLFRTILFWVFNRWRPAWVFSFASLRSMFSFGSKLLFAGLVNTIFDNLYFLVIGKLFSAGDLGFYSRAKRLQALPVKNISGSVARVIFPVFSSIEDDKVRLKRGMSKALTTLSLVSFPLMIGLAVVAKPLVIVLLTEKWLPCVPYFQLLCVVGLLYPLHSINLNVLKAQGRSDLFLLLEILKKIMVVIAIAITYRWGIVPMIYGQIATSCLAYYLNVYYTGKLLDYPITEQIQDLLPSMTLSGIMGLGVYSLKYIPITNEFALLFAQIITAFVLYVGLCYIFRISYIINVIETIKSNRKTA